MCSVNARQVRRLICSFTAPAISLRSRIGIYAARWIGTEDHMVDEDPNITSPAGHVEDIRGAFLFLHSCRCCVGTKTYTVRMDYREIDSSESYSITWSNCGVQLYSNLVSRRHSLGKHITDVQTAEAGLQLASYN